MKAMDVGGQLAIESVQDTAKQMSKESGVTSMGGGYSESTAPQATGSTAPSAATSPNTSTPNMSGGGASFAPTLPMSESGESSSTTYATLTEGKITMGSQ